MRKQPATCRVHTFFDGQNIFKAAAEVFGHQHPNYDPVKLSDEVVALEPGRTLKQVHFYTGIHDQRENALWYAFWTNKLNALQRQGVHVVRRPLKYSMKPVEIAPGNFQKVRVGREKGIDIRIALDLVRLARLKAYDVAIVFSQDQDLAEAVTEVKAISAEIDHWIRLECAFPAGTKKHNRRGLTGTLWRKLDQALYDRCIDPIDYRPRRPRK